MKSIYIDDDLAAIRQAVREFVENEIVPNVEEWERAGEIPREILEHMGKLGFFGLRVPEGDGGIGLGHIASVVFAGACAIMLLWSKPWLDRFRYGPLEWLWRSLARGAMQPMRRRSAG